MAARFPDAPLHGIYTGRLNNDGEALTLKNALNDVIFTFAYRDRAPWPAGADGAGDSLHRLSRGDPTNAANWCAAGPTPGASAPTSCRDSDDDGLPDAWELAHRLNELDSTGNHGANGDPDDDGLSNLKEYLAGTDPMDAQSYLRFESISVGAGVLLTFNASSNKTYTVQYTGTFDGGSWQRLTEVAAELTNRVVIIADSAVTTNRFYRLITPQRP